MRIVHTDGTDSRFIELCRELDHFLNETVGVEEQSEYNQYNTLEDIHNVVLLIENEKAVACGSCKEFEEGVAEIKRVFVKKEYRRRGFSRTLIDVIESEARNNGYKSLVLETGNQLKVAFKMYQSMGYEVTDNFGQYENMPDSICMKKTL